MRYVAAVIILVLFPEHVILFQTGQIRDKAKSAEVFDPKTMKSISCNVEDYPLEVEEAAGAVVGGILISCGGHQGNAGATDQCFKLQGKYRLIHF